MCLEDFLFPSSPYRLGATPLYLPWRWNWCCWKVEQKAKDWSCCRWWLVSLTTLVHSDVSHLTASSAFVWLKKPIVSNLGSSNVGSDIMLELCKVCSFSLTSLMRCSPSPLASGLVLLSACLALLYSTLFSHCTAGHCKFLLRGIILSYLILSYLPLGASSQ